MYADTATERGKYSRECAATECEQHSKDAASSPELQADVAKSPQKRLDPGRPELRARKNGDM